MLLKSLLRQSGNVMPTKLNDSTVFLRELTNFVFLQGSNSGAVKAVLCVDVCRCKRCLHDARTGCILRGPS